MAKAPKAIPVTTNPAKSGKGGKGGGGEKTETIRLLHDFVQNADVFNVDVEALVKGVDGKVKSGCPLTLYHGLKVIGAGNTDGSGNVVFPLVYPVVQGGEEISVRARVDGSTAESFYKFVLPKIEEKKFAVKVVDVREEGSGFAVELSLETMEAGQPTSATVILMSDNKELTRVDTDPSGRATVVVTFPQSEGGKEKTVVVQWHRAEAKVEVKVQLPVAVTGAYSKSVRDLAKANLKLWKKEPRRIWQHFGAATVMFLLAAWIFSAAGAGQLGLIFAVVCAVMAGRGIKRVIGFSLGIIPLLIVGGIAILKPNLIAEPMFYALLVAYGIGGACYFVEAITIRPDGTPALNWYPKLATIIFVGLIVFALMGGFVANNSPDDFNDFWGEGDFQETSILSWVGEATTGFLYGIPVVGKLFKMIGELLERLKYAIVFLVGLMIMLAYAGVSEGFQKLFGGTKKPAEAGKKDGGAPSMGKLIQSDIIGEGIWAAVSKGLASIFIGRGEKK